MYNAHQIDCLKQLGIQFLSSSKAEASAHSVPQREIPGSAVNSGLLPHSDVEEQAYDWPELLLSDLKVLFPELSQEGSRLKLTSEKSWLVESKSTRIIATKTQLITPSFDQLTVKQLKQVWSGLQEMSTSFKD